MSNEIGHPGQNKHYLLWKLPKHPIDYLYLMDFLKTYRSPRDKISRMIKKKEIIQVKKGLRSNEITEFFEYDLRLDINELSGLDIELVREIERVYKNKSVTAFLKWYISRIFPLTSLIHCNKRV
jgi:hypothetical protein